MATAEPLIVSLNDNLPSDFFSTSRLYQISVEQYLALDAAGVFDDGPKVELLAGVLVDKMIKNPAHTAAKQILFREIQRLLPTDWHVLQEDPIRLARSMPEPDLTVAKGCAEAYRQRHPTPGDVCLVVEVSESSLAQDRGLKRRLYAEAPLIEYWIVNLIDRCIEVYTQPSGPTPTPSYQTQHNYTVDDEIPLSLGGRTLGKIPVRVILGDAT